MNEGRKRGGVIRGSDVDPGKLACARSMRRDANHAESVAWEALRDRRWRGWKFRRQQVIDGFVADFYCAARRVVIEIDGHVHDDPVQRELDAQRTAVFAKRGIRVVRVRDIDVLEGRLLRHLEASSPLSCA